MFTSSRIAKASAWLSATATFAGLAIGGQAQATVFDLNLTGTVANATTSSFDIGATHYDRWILSLDGLTPFTLAQGDEIKVNVQLDQSVTIPGATTLMVTTLALESILNEPVATDGTVQFFNGGAAGSSWTGSSLGALVGSYVGAGATPVTFDQLFADFTVTQLSDPSADVTGSLLYYTLFSPAPGAPEPATWAMMLAGFGLAGSLLRRRSVAVGRTV